MHKRVRVSELCLGDTFSFSSHPARFVVTDLHSSDKNGPAVAFSNFAGQGHYTLTLMNPSITVKKFERI